MKKIALPVVGIFRLSFLFCFSLFGVLATNRIAECQVSVNRVIIDFKAGDPPVTNLLVRNSSANAMYVEVQPVEVQNAGEAEEKQVPTERFIISPKRFSLPPNGDRTVRLLIKSSPSDIEQVFRASFVPLEEESDFEAPKSAGKTAAMIRILTGVGILVFVSPAASHPDLGWERIGEKLRLTNTGNVNVLVDQLKACHGTNVDCVEFQPKRLYPGNVYEVSAAETKTFTFRKKIGDSFSTEVVPASNAK